MIFFYYTYRCEDVAQAYIFFKKNLIKAIFLITVNIQILLPSSDIFY